MQKKIKILKVRLDSVTLEEAIETALSLKKGYMTTPNPEILLEAQRNHKFKTILNNSALNIPDGIGLLWAAKYKKITANGKWKIPKAIFSLATVLFRPKYIKTVLKERVTGVDFFKGICKKTNKKIFLLGAEEGIAEKTAKKLKLNAETFAGTPKVEDQKDIINRINKSKAEILFVAYGAPAQEKWIARNLQKLTNIKLAVGIGGTFDFISGKTKRAPKLMQKLGLEWLYRLIQQPKRIKRIYNATIKFPIKVIFS